MHAPGAGGAAKNFIVGKHDSDTSPNPFFECPTLSRLQNRNIERSFLSRTLDVYRAGTDLI